MLKAWLRENRRTRRWLADQLGISEVSVSRITAGLQKPSLDTAVRIQQVTGIPAASFSSVTPKVEE